MNISLDADSVEGPHTTLGRALGSEAKAHAERLRIARQEKADTLRYRQAGERIVDNVRDLVQREVGRAADRLREEISEVVAPLFERK